MPPRVEAAIFTNSTASNFSVKSLVTPTETPTQTPTPVCTEIKQPVSAIASSEANDNWVALKVIDGENDIGWSSKSHSSETGEEWIEVDLGDKYDVHTLTLVPRIKDNNIVAFPKDFTLLYKSDYEREYSVLYIYENYQATTREEYEFDVYARYIKIQANKLTFDPDGKYRFQLMEIIPYVRCNLITTPSPERTPTPTETPTQTPTPTPTPTPSPTQTPTITPISFATGSDWFLVDEVIVKINESSNPLIILRNLEIDSPPMWLNGSMGQIDYMIIKKSFISN